jgi:hypothetical protein
VSLLVVLSPLGDTIGSTASASGFAPPPIITTKCLATSIACHAAGTFTSTSQWGGGYVQAQVEHLTASNNASANEELWVITTTDGLNASGSWAEVGYSIGQPGCASSLHWFYEVVKNGAGSPHCITTSKIAPIVGDWCTLEVQENTSSDWYMYIDGVSYAQDTSAAGWNKFDQVGLEYRKGNTIGLGGGDVHFRYNEVRAKRCCTWYYWNEGGKKVDHSTVFNWVWTTTNPWKGGYDAHV